jgi:hypothetical protein
MDIFEGLLDSETLEVDHQHVRITDATFILISDFGLEGLASRWEHSKLEQYVALETKRIWRSNKHASLISHVAPFINLKLPSEAALEQYQPPMLFKAPEEVCAQVKSLLSNLLQSLNLPPKSVPMRIAIEDWAFQVLCDSVYTLTVTNEAYRLRNYRGIKDMFNKYIAEPVSDKLWDFQWNNQIENPVILLKYSDDKQLSVRILFTQKGIKTEL